MGNVFDIYNIYLQSISYPNLHLEIFKISKKKKKKADVITFYTNYSPETQLFTYHKQKYITLSSHAECQ